jgi:N-acetylglucosaminyl-diphospho-decaprenol L-rhamnosyltransferase
VLSLQDITAVVLDWNLPGETIRCVDCLIADGVPTHRIVIAENGPTPQNWSAIQEKLSSCVLVRIHENVGFARANNLGVQALPGEAYLIVNNDAFVHKPGSVDRLVQALERDDIGVAVPRLLNADLSLQPSVSPFTRPLPALVRASGLSRFVPERWKPSLTTHWDHRSSRAVDQAVGAVMLIEGRLWEELGGLRETSFMYAEDLDLCWRARQLGRTTWFEAGSEFVHLGGTSSSARWNGRERAAQISRAEAAMIRDHLSPARAAATLGFMRLGVAARLTYYRLARNGAAAAEYRGSLEGLGGARHRGAERPRRDPEVDVLRPAG